MWNPNVENYAMTKLQPIFCWLSYNYLEHYIGVSLPDHQGILKGHSTSSTVENILKISYLNVGLYVVGAKLEKMLLENVCSHWPLYIGGIIWPPGGSEKVIPSSSTVETILRETIFENRM